MGYLCLFILYSSSSLHHDLTKLLGIYNCSIMGKLQVLCVVYQTARNLDLATVDDGLGWVR